MAGPGTTITGPLISGPKYMADGGTPVNTGLAQLFQSATITQNGTTAVSATMTLPPNSTILDIVVDTTTAWNSGTSAILSVGTAAATTTYLGNGSTTVSTKTAGRTVVAGASPTGAQLLAMQNIGTNTSVVATVTPTGATSAGTTTVTLEYIQNVENIDSYF